MTKSIGDIGPHEGQIGFIIELIVTDVVTNPDTGEVTETPLNISTATIKDILLKMEGGARITKPASFSTNGSDGKIRCVSALGEIGNCNRIYVEAHVVMPAEEFYTETLILPAYPHL